MIPGAGNPLQRVISGTIIRASIISGAVVLVLATLVAAYWSSWLLKPLRALEAASRTLASGDYTARVRVPRGEHELRSLAEGFNAMAEEIGAQESTRRRFVADAAHELRTPVSLLSARIEMLREGVYDPTPEQWDSLQGSVGRLARLVEDLQVLARLDAGRIALGRRPVDAVSFLRELAHEFRPAAGKAGVALSLVEEHTSPPSVLADPVRLHQVMANIVANAVRHTPAGGSVTLRAASQPSPGSVESVPTGADQHVELTVEDTGPGIPREDRERVFDRFVRLDAGRGRDHGGSGLGLAIARRLAELQDGTIRVEGPRLSDSGARFVVTLPADA
jgi:two-component system sensor histidine kinase BaeS